MSASRVGRLSGYWWIGCRAYPEIPRASRLPISPLQSRRLCCCRRSFSSSTRYQEQYQQRGQRSFGSRLRNAWNNTKVEWYPIPVGLGIGFLGFAQLYRVRQREKLKSEEEEKRHTENEGHSSGEGSEGRPKKRKRIRPSGPWYDCRGCHRTRVSG